MMKRCKIIRLILIAALSVVSSMVHCIHAQDRMAGNDSLSFEVILTDKMFSDFNSGNQFIPVIDITPERFILLSVPDQYYVLGWGGIVPLGNRLNPGIQAFAYTPDGLLLTVRGNELCSFDNNGNLSVLVKLPRTGMGISAGREVMYLFDRNPGQKGYPLYVFAREGKYLKLLEATDPISSVAETDDAVLFAAGARLYSVIPATREAKLLFTEANGRKILSVTTDRVNNISYFSTAEEIFAVRDNEVTVVSAKTGGILRYFNGLIVLNPDTRLVMRILGLEDELTVKQVSPSEVTFQAGPVIQAPIETSVNRAAQEAPSTPTVQTRQGTETMQTVQTTQAAQTTQATLNTQAPKTSQDTRITEDSRNAQAVQAPQDAPGKETSDVATVKVLTNESIVALVRNEVSDNIIITLIRRAKSDFSLTTDDVIDLSQKGVSPDLIIEMRKAMQRQVSETQK